MTESETSTAVLADSTNLPIKRPMIQDSSDEEITLKRVVPDKKEETPAEEEKVEPLIHLPLPIAFKSKSEVYRARQRFTHLNVENIKTAKTESVVHDRKRPSSQAWQSCSKSQTYFIRTRVKGFKYQINP